MFGFKLSNPFEKNKSADVPLGMTVHDLPTPGDVAQADAQRTRSGRRKMLWVVLICAAPVIASYFTFYVVRPESRRNYGELMANAPMLPAAEAMDLQGKPLALSTLKGQWLLVSVGDPACPNACEQNLYFQRQLREVLGKEKERMDRVWLLQSDAPVREALLPVLHDVHVLRLPTPVLNEWLAPAQGQQLQDHLYVVDPMGRWMMRFPAHMDVASASKAKRDLDRLLRASVSWDKPGR